MTQRLSTKVALIALTISASLAVHAMADDLERSIDVPPGELATALQLLAEQSGVEFISYADQLKGLHTKGVSGTLSALDAATRLIEGTPLMLRDVDGALLIALPGAPSSSAPEAAKAPGTDADTAAATTTSADPNTFMLDEIVVTGTYLRNTEPVSPVLVYTREDFDEAGAATAQEFLALLPQNFGGGPSSDTSGDVIDGLPFDPGMGSSVNLRGVGSSSTLVLVDGRRLAAAGRGEYSDISMIPLAAVERIEVVTDGASALYGSDAIGGVVNFIMRKDFSGAETRLRYGDTTEGGLSQQQGSQLLGMNWHTGNAVLSYDYLNQSALGRQDRDFSANASGSMNGPKALIPAQERHSAALFGKQELGGRVTASMSAMYSRRDGESWNWESGAVEQIDARREQYGAGLGLGIELGGSWRAQVNGSYDEGTVLRNIVVAAATPRTGLWDSTQTLWSTGVLVSGDLVPLPWGAIKLAAGADYREEKLEYENFNNGALRSLLNTEAQTVKATYAEISVPIGERGDRPRAPLMLSIAGRYEDYSTFGHTLDPTYGLRWTPLSALSLYATYGTSFKAPNLFQFQENPFFNTSIVTSALPGVTRALVLSGNSSDLQEQTAKTLTAGIEWSIPVGDGLRARLNYFDIDYDNRIQTVEGGPALVLATPAYESLVTRRGEIPDADFNALVARYLAGTDARVLGCTAPLSPAGACSTSPESFTTIVNLKLQNFAAVQVSGLDLSLSQEVALGRDRLSFDLDASYFLQFDQQLTPAGATQDILNVLYNPVDFRARGSVSWRREQWNSTLAVNFTSEYSTAGALLRTNDEPMAAANIPSWTTFDFVLGYTVAEGNRSGWLEGLGLSLSVFNLFDEDPPYVEDLYFGLGYDPANADPRGRMVSFSVRKRW